MPVGHHGSMSKHPAWVKIAILEYLEARLKDAADHPDVDIGAENVYVYDPFTTDMDFYIFVDASWSKYLKLYAKYYDQEFSGSRQKELEPDLPTKYGEKYSTRINKAIYDIGPDDTNREIFNASKSKTEIFYTIQQMKNILELEEPYP